MADFFRAWNNPRHSDPLGNNWADSFFLASIGWIRDNLEAGLARSKKNEA